MQKIAIAATEIEVFISMELFKKEKMTPDNCWKKNPVEIYQICVIKEQKQWLHKIDKKITKYILTKF